MKTILLIGSTGYVGKKLKHKLSKNYTLICPGRKIGFDIRKKNELRKYLKENIDLVINLTGQQTKNRRLMTETIIQGNKNILEITSRIKKNILLIYISTSLVYGNSEKQLTENSKKNPVYAYEKLKYKIEKEYIKNKKNYLILRFSNLYGSKKKSGIISNILNSIKNKKEFYFDNINTFKNFIHIDDVINIIEYLISKNIRNKVLNIANQNICFKNLAKTLVKITNNSFRFSNKDINISQTLSQKIDNKVIKNIIKKYKFKTLESFLNNEI